jgi:hypothetical protein
MGGAMGNPIDDAKQARINEIIQDVTTRFATEFSGAYTQAVIKQAKADLEGGEGGDGYKLMEAPTESEVLMSGTLEKVQKINCQKFAIINQLIYQSIYQFY